MKTEKQKMLAGEPYQAWDDELVAGRLACRHTLKAFNDTIPRSDEWQKAIDKLIPSGVGKNNYIEPPFRCDYGDNIKVGKNFYANFNCVILDVGEVHFGDNVMLAPNVQIYTAGHPLSVKKRVEEGVEFGLSISIGDNAWIGGGVIICPGISIGENSVIGAGSVVTKDIPANVLAVGNPCKVVREIDQDSDD